MTWLRSFTPAAAAGASATVVVFPQAGSGCLRLHANAAALPQGLDLWGVQLPGREDRLADPPAGSLIEVVECVGTELRSSAFRRPLVLLGVSLGALLAHEVAGALESAGTAASALVVAAARSPEHWSTFPAADPPREELTALLHPAVRAPGPADYAVAALRADLGLMAGYAVPPDPLTRTALLSVSGRRDGVVTAAQMTGWRDRSLRYLGHRELDADHHSFLDRDVLAATLSCVADVAGACREVLG
ncbi:thioesterase domain-containing protein [Streptomyces toyocaensis]|nr:thioesterase domain-containing protein [Streptomyces toyocaensis]